MIKSIEKSLLKNKRFRVTLTNNDHYDFGLDGGETYIDHADIQKRSNYRKRHIANGKERQLIESLIPSPALFSYYILWGDSTNINENIKTLNRMISRKK